MANTFVREAIKNADTGLWADYELPQNRAGSVGQYTSYLFDDSGDLTVKKGLIGFDNSSLKGVFNIDTEVVVDISGVSADNWAKIEVALSGGVPVFTAEDISGATDPSTIPTTFTDAYAESKQGYYITSTKRCVGIVWIDGAGDLAGIINVRPFIKGYVGTVYDDADRYFFNVENSVTVSDQGMIPIGGIIHWHGNLTGCPNLPDNFVECNGQVLSDSRSPFDGETMPNINVDGRFVRGDATSGTEQDHAVGPHEHTVPGQLLVPSGGSTYRALGGAGNSNSTTIAIASGNNDTENRPINISMRFIIRIF